jgi:hypothetical protein
MITLSIFKARQSRKSITNIPDIFKEESNYISLSKESGLDKQIDESVETSYDESDEVEVDSDKPITISLLFKSILNV